MLPSAQVRNEQAGVRVLLHSSAVRISGAVAVTGEPHGRERQRGEEETRRQGEEPPGSVNRVFVLFWFQHRKLYRQDSAGVFLFL